MLVQAWTPGSRRRRRRGPCGGSGARRPSYIHRAVTHHDKARRRPGSLELSSNSNPRLRRSATPAGTLDLVPMSIDLRRMEARVHLHADARARVCVNGWLSEKEETPNLLRFRNKKTPTRSGPGTSSRLLLGNWLCGSDGPWCSIPLRRDQRLNFVFVVTVHRNLFSFWRLHEYG